MTIDSSDYCNWDEPEFELHSLINSGATNKLYPEKVKEFIDTRKCDVNLADSAGMTPLHEAAQWGLFDIIKLLITDYGADVNAQNKDGWTPLIEASFVNRIYSVDKGMLETVKVLVEHGADKNIRCKEGKVAIDYAKEIYFDRSIYYYLSNQSDDNKSYPFLSEQILGKHVSLKLKDDIRYCIIDYELEECGVGKECCGGMFFSGKISQICDSVQFDETDDPFCYGSQPSPSCAILRAYETNESGVRTWKYYQFHHDDIEIEIINSACSLNETANMTGFNVEIRSRLPLPIFYQIKNTIRTLSPGDKFTGYFKQMTVRQFNGSFEKAHIEDLNGNETIFFADEIIAKKI